MQLMGKDRSLIFIYNAKSGSINAIIDYAHKFISPETYKCNLCNLTYDNFGRIRQWKHFIESLKIKVFFKYKDHLRKIGINDNIQLPAIFSNTTLMISATEINKCNTLEELITLIQSKIINI